MPAPQTRRGEFGVAAIAIVVISVASIRSGPTQPPAPPVQTQRALFDEVVREEPAARDRARDDWAHHRWSQQDAFGAFERDRASSLAAQKGLTVQDLLLVVDHGLRQHWPGPDGKPLDVATVPLKPRAMD